jgi:hypothetical protein
MKRLTHKNAAKTTPKPAKDAAFGWLADLLKEIPSAARYMAELEELASSHEKLQAQDRIQKSELEAKDVEIRNLKTE